jgi:hypothetical protein
MQPSERCEGAVGGTVVHEDHLPGVVQLVEHGAQLVEERTDAQLLVVNGDDDRQHADSVCGRLWRRC